jgi:hypothetical protein
MHPHSAETVHTALAVPWPQASPAAAPARGAPTMHGPCPCPCSCSTATACPSHTAICHSSQCKGHAAACRQQWAPACLVSTCRLRPLQHHATAVVALLLCWRVKPYLSILMLSIGCSPAARPVDARPALPSYLVVLETPSALPLPPSLYSWQIMCFEVYTTPWLTRGIQVACQQFTSAATGSAVGISVSSFRFGRDDAKPSLRETVAGCRQLRAADSHPYSRRP